jgi:hypothetical protein
MSILQQECSLCITLDLHRGSIVDVGVDIQYNANKL